MAQSPKPQPSGAQVAVWVAWMVHAYTAGGAVLAYLSLRAVVAGNFRSAFFWMLVATVVDATDGWLARRARVRERLPAFNGARLDDLVDYLTFVFVPAFLIDRAALLPSGWAFPVISAMLMASAYGFTREEAKTPDHFFTGFPSYWNVVSLYLFAARLPTEVNAAVLLTLCGLVFVPIGYVYPTRTPKLLVLTLALSVVWGALVSAMIWRLPTISPTLLGWSLIFPAYYTVLSLVLHRRRVVRV